jgi:hypothetical protein
MSLPYVGLKSKPTKKSVTSCLLSASCWFLAWLILQILKLEVICSSGTSVECRRLTQFYIYKTELFITIRVQTSILRLKFTGKGLKGIHL